MKNFKMVFLFVLFLYSFSLKSFASSVLVVKCDVNDAKIYLDGKFKGTCGREEPISIMVSAGKHKIELKKLNKNGIYYYFKKTVNLTEGVELTIKTKSRKRYTETYYWKKALKSNQPEDYLLYLKKYPRGKYARKAKAKLKKIGYLVEVWDKTFGGSRSDEAKAIIETKDGGYLVAGKTISYGNDGEDIWLIKIDKNGNKIWDKTFGGSRSDEANAIIETKDGGYLVAGKTSSYSYGNYYPDAWLIKIDKNGNKIWDKTFGGSRSDGANAIIETKDGGYLVAGYNDFNHDYKKDAWLIKIDKNGNKIWDKTFGGGELHSIIETRDGGYLAAGTTRLYNDDYVWIIKIDKNGNKIWDRTFGGSEFDGANAIIETKDGGYLVAGFTYSYGNGGSDVWLIKLDKNGNKIWDRTFGGSRTDGANAIIETKDGGYLVAGYTSSYDKGEGDIWLIKIDKNGNKLWDRTFGGSEWDYPYSIIDTRNGGYLVAGFTHSYGNGGSDVWIIKLKPIK